MTTEISYPPREFPNLGWLHVECPVEFRHNIREEIDEATGTDVRNSLAGQITASYDLPRLRTSGPFRLFLQQLAATYDDTWPVHKSHVERHYGEMVLELGECWCNFQERHQFHPLHDHNGVFSFVIWIQVPFFALDEEKQFAEANRPNASQFGFTYQDVLGKTHNSLVPVDKHWEWQMAFFPSGLFHQVHPFYSSNAFRISVSGNLALQSPSTPPIALLGTPG